MYVYFAEMKEAKNWISSLQNTQRIFGPHEKSLFPEENHVVDKQTAPEMIKYWYL